LVMRGSWTGLQLSIFVAKVMDSIRA
jgi:hypothetical protein